MSDYDLLIIGFEIIFIEGHWLALRKYEVRTNKQYKQSRMVVFVLESSI